MRRRGSSEIPARCAVVPLMAWKRCGILTTRDMKGKPAKNVFLISSTPDTDPQSPAQIQRLRTAIQHARTLDRGAYLSQDEIQEL
jgi:hypothetical protein